MMIVKVKTYPPFTAEILSRGERIFLDNLNPQIIAVIIIR